jgi:hypothetical protein
MRAEAKSFEQIESSPRSDRIAGRSGEMRLERRFAGASDELRDVQTVNEAGSVYADESPFLPPYSKFMSSVTLRCCRSCMVYGP